MTKGTAPTKELIELAALDAELYGRTFFPETLRQQSPPFHEDIFHMLGDTAHRYTALEVFRGGGKTTLLRLFTSRRIAYGISRTIMFVSAAQEHSKSSVGWVRSKIMKNHRWAGTFGLKPGIPWTDEHAVILHETLGHTTHLVATGITGQTRGLNLEDYRPDLIVIDDPCHAVGTPVYYNGTWVSVEDHPNAIGRKLQNGLEVRLDGMPEPEIVTEDHRYWAAVAKCDRFGQAEELEDPQWVEAKDLTRDHFIGTHIPDMICSAMYHEAYYYLLGLWWGDGDLSGNGNAVRWSISSQEVLNKAVTSMEQLGWKPHMDPGIGCSRLRVGNSELWRYLTTWKRGEFSMKLPPEEILLLPKFEQSLFIKGYIDADGCINREGTGIRVASKYLSGLVFLSWILARLEIRSTIRLGRPGGASVIRGRTVFGSRQYELGFTDYAHLFAAVAAPKRVFSKVKLKDGFLWRRLKSVENASETIFIPLRIEDHTYITAYGLSHNCDEENTATPEQRLKVSNLVFGALTKSLTPQTESPGAKIVLLQTCLNKDDLISNCHKDAQWASRKYSCFTPRGESSWPSRYTTEFLKTDKQAHIDRNQLSLWLREMECKVTAPETSDFRSAWLRYWEPGDFPMGFDRELVIVIGIDPVPPPSEKAIQVGLHKNDFEVISVVGKDVSGNYYLLDYSMNRGHTPEWTETEFFRLVHKWSPLRARVEGTGYQKTLEWLLRQAMKRRGRYVLINAPSDRRQKRHRILQAFSGIASQGKLFVRRDQVEFLEQFEAYPSVNHDDVLDSVGMAMEELLPVVVSDIIPADPALVGVGYSNNVEDWRGAP